MKPSRSLKKRDNDKRNCIWMQSAVVPVKYCNLDYDCTVCRYDKAMQDVALENERLTGAGDSPKGRRARIVSWKEKMKERPVWKRPCIHHMKGRIDYRACNNDYRCGSCEFDQFFHDQHSVHAMVKPVDVYNIKGFHVPQGYYLHTGHTWIKLEEDSMVRVGLDEFALRLLGPFESIEAPLMGKEVIRDMPDIIASRGDLKAKFLSPVSGIVTAINPEVRENGSLANKSPYSGGWVMSVLSKDLRRDIGELMFNKETKEFMESQVEKLYEVIEEVAGPLAADGGYLGNDIYGNLPQLDWNNLTGLFLKT